MNLHVSKKCNMKDLLVSLSRQDDGFTCKLKRNQHFKNIFNYCAYIFEINHTQFVNPFLGFE